MGLIAGHPIFDEVLSRGYFFFISNLLLLHGSTFVNYASSVSLLAISFVHETSLLLTYYLFIYLFIYYLFLY